MYFSINILKIIECAFRGCCRGDDNCCDGCYCIYTGGYDSHEDHSRNDTCFGSCCFCCKPTNPAPNLGNNLAGSEKLCCSSCELKTTCQPLLKCLYDICKSFKSCGVKCFQTGYRFGEGIPSCICKCCDLDNIRSCMKVFGCIGNILCKALKCLIELGS